VTDEELARAKQRVEHQTQEANRRSTLAGRIKAWYADQNERNGFREMVDVIVRGN
jgi:hypothetical protein